MADLISSSVAHAASPVPTPAALLRRTIYTPTSSWDYATTAISSDQYYMGAIGISGGETWSLSCINEPFTTSGVYAGCGYDDLYTSCSGSFAYGADGDVIRCYVGDRSKPLNIRITDANVKVDIKSNNTISDDVHPKHGRYRRGHVKLYYLWSDLSTNKTRQDSR
ncbi:hypothetical protein KC343_g2791 [Hortaea werneckii]|nr:hypothetical protein KC343_g2791 [Hortaea werneckii]